MTVNFCHLFWGRRRPTRRWGAPPLLGYGLPVPCTLTARAHVPDSPRWGSFAYWTLCPICGPLPLLEACTRCRSCKQSGRLRRFPYKSLLRRGMDLYLLCIWAYVYFTWYRVHHSASSITETSPTQLISMKFGTGGPQLKSWIVDVTAVSKPSKITVFWEVTLCGLVHRYWHFEITRFHCVTLQRTVIFVHVTIINAIKLEENNLTKTVNKTIANPL